MPYPMHMNTTRIHFLLPATFIAMVLLNSCEKCSTCSYTLTSLGTQSTYEESYCGDKDELEEFETGFSENAQQQGVVAACRRD